MWKSPMRASSAATARSHASISSKPPATAHPCTRDRDAPRVGDAGEDPRDGGAELGPGNVAREHRDVGAGAERVAAAADDDHPALLVLLGAREAGVESAQKREVVCVLDLRPVQPERDDLPARL